MQKNIPEVEELIRLIGKLPGLGKKSATRIALRLINDKEQLKSLTNSLATVYKNAQRCSICGLLKNKDKTCLCSEKHFHKICVVESLEDQIIVESSGVFSQSFHILGGLLSDKNLKKNSDLLIPSLVQRIKNNSIDEVILALSSTTEGAITCHYIIDEIKNFNLNVKISKLAQGMSIGQELNTADDGTLISAFKNRRSVTND